VDDDENFVLELLKQQHLLLVQGSAFACKDSQHFRIVFLPDQNVLIKAIERLDTFLKDVRQDKQNLGDGSSTRQPTTV
jgi:alanine-synthesizing transaminase